MRPLFLLLLPVTLAFAAPIWSPFGPGGGGWIEDGGAHHRLMPQQQRDEGFMHGVGKVHLPIRLPPNGESDKKFHQDASLLHDNVVGFEAEDVKGLDGTF